MEINHDIKTFRFLPSILLLLFVSCDPDKVFSKFDKDFADNRWMKTDVRLYEFTIEEKADYTIDFNFSHIYDYQFPEVKIIMKMDFPNGIVVHNKVDMKIKSDGKELGDCAGDYCDLATEIFPIHTLEPGKYRLKISHDFNGEYLPNVLGVGITVKRTQK